MTAIDAFDLIIVNRYQPTQFTGLERYQRESGCASSKGWRVQREMNLAKARARSLVAWMAGRRETNDLKPSTTSP
jgi:hypothetical protein